LTSETQSIKQRAQKVNWEHASPSRELPNEAVKSSVFNKDLAGMHGSVVLAAHRFNRKGYFRDQCSPVEIFWLRSAGAVL
jgi:hypothetical protein